MRVLIGASMAAALAALPACGEDATGTGSGGLQGTWRASPADPGTHFTFSEHNGIRSINFVDSVGATVTLVVGSTTFSLTIAVPFFGSTVRSGTYTSTSDSLTIIDTASNDTLAFSFTLVDPTLTIVHTAGGAAFNFDNVGGDEPADVSGVFTRR